jgi:hypothetical protein
VEFVSAIHGVVGELEGVQRVVGEHEAIQRVVGELEDPGDRTGRSRGASVTTRPR